MSSLYDRIVEAFGTDNGAEIGRLVEVGRHAVYRWRDGDTLPSRENLLKISECSGVTLDWLMSGEGEKFPSTRSTVSEQISSAERDALTSVSLRLSVQPLRNSPLVAVLENSQLRFVEGQTMNIPANVAPETALTIEVLDDSWEPEGFKKGDVLVVERSNGNCSGQLVVALVNNQPMIRHFEQVGLMARFSALYDHLPVVQVAMNNVELKFVVSSITHKP